MPPITQDASASAYQIMSYCTLTSANKAEQRIEDVYTQIMHEFKAFLNKEMTNRYLHPAGKESFELASLCFKFWKEHFMKWKT
ncbi:putative DNA-directed RNA polymerase [Bienertia sinuspersici]